MAISIFLSTGFSSSLLPIPRKPVTIPSVSFPLKPRRFLPLSRVPPNPPRSSGIPTSCKPPTAGVLSSVATASRTLFFLLFASLLSVSGLRPPRALASAPTPTQQSQEMEEQDKQEPEESKQQDEQEPEESKQEGEDEVKKSEEEVKVEKGEALMQQRKEAEEVEADDEVKMYSAILSRNPGDVDALKCALYAKMRRANWDGALRYAHRLREAEPGEVDWRLLEAQLHELRGDLAEAERQFREVLAEDPLHIPALHVGTVYTFI